MNRPFEKNTLLAVMEATKALSLESLPRLNLPGTPVLRGTEVVHNGEIYTIEKVSVKSCELRHRIDQSVVIVDHGDYELVNTSVTNSHRPIESIPIDAEEKARKIYDILVPFLSLKGAPKQTDLRAAGALVGKSYSSMQRYLKRLRIDNHWRGCVKHIPGPREGTFTLEPPRLRLLRSLVDQIVKRKEGMTYSSVHEEISAAFKEHGLNAPSLNTVKKALRTRGMNLGVRNRIGEKAHRERRTASGGMLNTSRPLEMVEIDSTRADVIIVGKDREILCRPWVTFLIDVHTRVVLGVYVALHAPSAVSTGTVIVDAIFPKKERLKRLGLSGQEWPVYGVFERIVGLDRGSEHDNKAILNGLSLLNIPPPQFRKRIQHGAHIERLIGTFVGRMHLLPGTTFSNPKIKGDYDSEAMATLSIEEFEKWVVLEVIRYLNVPGSKDGLTPLQRWNDGWAAHPDKAPRRLTNPQEVKVALLPFEMRTATRDGIELKTVRYQSPNLRGIISQHKRVMVHYNPHDASRIWVRLSRDQTVEVLWVNQRTPVSFMQIALENKANRLRGNHPEILKVRQEAAAISGDVVVESKRLTKKVRKQRALEEERAEKAAAYIKPILSPRVIARKVDYSVPIAEMAVRRS